MTRRLSGQGPLLPNRKLLYIKQDGEPGAEEARVVAFGATNEEATLGILRASPCPVRVDDLVERIGRRRIPEEALYFEQGVVRLEAHFPDFRAWVSRLAPPTVEVMQREPPDREWAAQELFLELREAMAVPAWLNAWSLASILRRSGQARYLGLNRFSVLERPDDKERVRWCEAMARVLRERGAPTARGELVAELQKKATTFMTTVTVYLARPPFVSCGAGRVGLLERDLPGGAAAMAEALDHLFGVLERSGRGLGPSMVKAEVARLSESHSAWPVEMCLSVARSDPRFRQSKRGVVGLSRWEGVRVPARAEIVEQCLREAGGRVSVEAVQQRIQFYYGAATDRREVGRMANELGAVMREGWLTLEPGE